MELYAHFIVYLCFLVQTDWIILGFIQHISYYGHWTGSNINPLSLAQKM